MGINPIPQRGNQLLEYYPYADLQKDLNQHIPQVCKHLFQLLHKNLQPVEKRETNKIVIHCKEPEVQNHCKIILIQINI